MVGIIPTRTQQPAAHIVITAIITRRDGGRLVGEQFEKICEILRAQKYRGRWIVEVFLSKRLSPDLRSDVVRSGRYELHKSAGGCVGLNIGTETRFLPHYRE